MWDIEDPDANPLNSYSDDIEDLLDIDGTYSSQSEYEFELEQLSDEELYEWNLSLPF